MVHTKFKIVLKWNQENDEIFLSFLSNELLYIPLIHYSHSEYLILDDTVYIFRICIFLYNLF